MYQSVEAHPGPSQASKINLFAKIVDVFKLTSYFCQKYNPGYLKSSDYTSCLF